MTLSFLIRGVLLVAALASLGIMVYSADLSHPLLWLVSLVFGAWVVSPYWFLFRTLSKGEPNLVRERAVLLLSIGLACFGLSIYYDGFFVHLDAQNGLLFLFIPLWQWVAVGLVLWGLNFWRNRTRDI